MGEVFEDGGPDVEERHERVDEEEWDEVDLEESVPLGDAVGGIWDLKSVKAVGEGDREFRQSQERRPRLFTKFVSHDCRVMDVKKKSRTHPGDNQEGVPTRSVGILVRDQTDDEQGR